MSRVLAALLLVPALLTGGCMTTRTTQRTVYADGSRAGGWERPGQVDWVRETVTRSDGNPAAGAVAGGLIGALIGGSIFGHTHYDRWGYAHHHGSGAGALFGAAAGAAVGAAASSGPGAEDRTYEVMVRFNDGGSRVFLYRGAPPFRPGDEVVLTGRGLERM